MFSGIIAGTGKLTLLRQGNETRVRVEAEMLRESKQGESVAVDGVCLTVIDNGTGWFAAVVSPETLARTTLGERAAGGSAGGMRVNLERSVRLGERLGGHLVQGHVDGIGIVEGVRPEGSGRRIRVTLPADLEDCVVMKGSIAIDGVSLTIAGRGPRWFEVAIIPETLSVTRMDEYRSGTPVNLEVDVLGRYVVEYLKRRETAPAAPITREYLARRGFDGRDEEAH